MMNEIARQRAAELFAAIAANTYPMDETDAMKFVETLDWHLDQARAGERARVISAIVEKLEADYRWWEARPYDVEVRAYISELQGRIIFETFGELAKPALQNIPVPIPDLPEGAP